MIRSIIHRIKLKFSKKYRARVEFFDRMREASKNLAGIQRMEAPTGQIFELRTPE